MTGGPRVPGARPADRGREAFYAAERLIQSVFERSGGGVARIAGTTLTLPVEARFAAVDAAREYVGRVLALPAVRERFPRAGIAVAVRARRGDRAAHYEPLPPVIAVPDGPDGRWARRELVVLHEIAHHLDDSCDPAHGRCFCETLIELTGLVLGPEAAFVYRVLLSDSGLLGPRTG